MTKLGEYLASRYVNKPVPSSKKEIGKTRPTEVKLSNHQNFGRKCTSYALSKPVNPEDYLNLFMLI